MAAVIAGDLKFSGFFEPVPAEKFIEDPRKKALTREEIHFPDWTAIGAEALVKGGIRMAGPRMEIEIRLFDAVQGRMIVGRNTGEIRRPPDPTASRTGVQGLHGRNLRDKITFVRPRRTTARSSSPTTTGPAPPPSCPGRRST
jgi:hypothetical protein